MFFTTKRLSLLVVAMIAALECAAVEEDFEVAQSWAVLVGIDDYAGAEKLPYCAADQRALRDQLVASGFPADHVCTLEDQAADLQFRPTKENIEREFERIVAQVGQDDLLVVGFSGHGVQIEGKSYLCPIDGRLDDASQMISVDALLERLGKCPARLKLVVVDACRADPQLGVVRAPKAKPNESARALANDLKTRKLPPGIFLLSSCAPGEVSWDDAEAKQSVFMNFLLKGLKGPADLQRDGFVSLAELQSFVSTRTKARVVQRHGTLQVPFFRTDLSEAERKLPAIMVFAGAAPVVANVVPPKNGPPVAARPKGTHVPASLAGRRNPDLKRRLLNETGGNEQTVQAVERGLQWIAEHQLPNGMWSLTGTSNHGLGAYDGGSKVENYEAATAMAMLALLGHGHSPTSGDKYGPVAEKGMQALLRQQDKKGSFFRGARGDDWMYTQALCTLAMCDCSGLEPGNDALRAACELAVKFCVASQNNLGGWRYAPRQDSDTSVTGWMVMALQSAKNIGIDVPEKTWKGINAYLDLAAIGVAKDPEITLKAEPELGSRYSYQPGMSHDPVMTAEALLCRIHLGWRQDDLRLQAGCFWLLSEWLPEIDDRDVYYWYYATQTMYHMQGQWWAKWNGMLRDMLLGGQVKVGINQGSWNPLGIGPDQEIGADLWSLNHAGGRHYVTCFSLCMLEVYYRNLPYYSDVKKQEEAKLPRL